MLEAEIEKATEKYEAEIEKAKTEYEKSLHSLAEKHGMQIIRKYTPPYEFGESGKMRYVMVPNSFSLPEYSYTYNELRKLGVSPIIHV